MRVSTRLSDSIHILAFLQIYRGKVPLTSENIAGSVETSPVVVRRLMSALREGGLIETVPGFADPRLDRPADEISLYDIYLAVEGPGRHLFAIDEKTAPECIVGGNIQATLAEYYQQAETAAQAKLAGISLQDVLDSILVKQAQKEAQQRKENSQ